MSYTVVLDTTTHWGYEYADTVTFTLSPDQDLGQRDRCCQPDASFPRAPT